MPSARRSTATTNDEAVRWLRRALALVVARINLQTAPAHRSRDAHGLASAVRERLLPLAHRDPGIAAACRVLDVLGDDPLAAGRDPALLARRLRSPRRSARRTRRG